MASLLTSAEVAERWHCDRSWVTRLARARKLSGMRLGSDWRFSLAAVEAYERAHTSEPVPVIEARTARAVGASTSANPPAVELDGEYAPVVRGSVPWRSTVIEDRPAGSRGSRDKEKAALPR